MRITIGSVEQETMVVGGLLIVGHVRMGSSVLTTGVSALNMQKPHVKMVMYTGRTPVVIFKD